MDRRCLCLVFLVINFGLTLVSTAMFPDHTECISKCSCWIPMNTKEIQGCLSLSADEQEICTCESSGIFLICTQKGFFYDTTKTYGCMERPSVLDVEKDVFSRFGTAFNNIILYSLRIFFYTLNWLISVLGCLAFAFVLTNIWPWETQKKISLIRGSLTVLNSDDPIRLYPECTIFIRENNAGHRKLLAVVDADSHCITNESDKCDPK